MACLSTTQSGRAMVRVRRFLPLLLAVLASGCAGFERPASGSWSAVDTRGVRAWAGDAVPIVADQQPVGDASATTFDVIALSGGGPDGAYGAGLLAGWAEAGTRPTFDVVTGVSTGALMAPFVFLGPAYDDLLQDLYTGPHVATLLDGGVLALLRQPGLYRHDAIRDLLARHVTPDLLATIAREHRRGRRLYVATGSLDAQRQTVWDMGAVATDGTDDAVRLFRDVMLAAVSVPLLFPPVALPGEQGGSGPPEMHGDAALFGGFLAGPEMFPDGGRCRRPGTTCRLYVLVHNKLLPEPADVPLRMAAIGKRAADSMVKANLTLTLRTTWHAMRDAGVRFGAARLETDEPGVSPVDFDRAYMTRMYGEGHARGVLPGVWHDLPDLLRGPCCAGEGGPRVGTGSVAPGCRPCLHRPDGRETGS